MYRLSIALFATAAVVWVLGTVVISAHTGKPFTTCLVRFSCD